MTSVRQAARAATTSGRSCSLACRSLLPPQAGAPQRPAEGREAEPPSGALGRHLGVLGRRGVRPPGHRFGQHRRVRPAQRGPTAAAGQRSAAAFAGPPQPAVHRAQRDPESLGENPPAALAPHMCRKHPLPQIRRQSHGS
jgi:hypothetical protein